jgi:hypothetical protein
MRRLTMAALALLMAGSLYAAEYYTYESVTVAASSVGLASATINPTGYDQINRCIARLETAQIRYRIGADPTAAEGIILEVGDILNIGSAADAQGIRFIRTGGASGTLKVQCWRQ